jgi:hypothetical protein
MINHNFYVWKYDRKIKIYDFKTADPISWVTKYSATKTVIKPNIYYILIYIYLFIKNGRQYAEFDREDHGPILSDCDWEGTEIIW